MRYTVEDTPEGFRLTTYVAPGPAHVYDEPGGHGPLEALYVQAEEARGAARARSGPLTYERLHGGGLHSGEPDTWEAARLREAGAA